MPAMRGIMTMTVMSMSTHENDHAHHEHDHSHDDHTHDHEHEHADGDHTHATETSAAEWHPDMPASSAIEASAVTEPGSAEAAKNAREEHAQLS